MPGKIFINYRRDDSKADARGLHDRLSRTFGKTRVFMDVDNLLAGQRFDQELEKALDSCDVFITVIGPQWLEVLKARETQGERDYVREEIAAALKRKIIVIPVLVDGAALPTKATLPEDLHELVLYQKHEISHEKFGRDVEELITAIKTVMKQKSPPRNIPLKKIVTGLMICALFGAIIYTYPFISSSIKSALENSAQIAEKTEKEAEAKMPRGDPQLQPHSKANIPSDNPGDTFKDCADCPEMVIVPSGDYMMGSPKSEKSRQEDEGPRHKVSIANNIAVGKFEITFDEWDACAKDGGCNGYRPSDQGWGRGSRPVINVSWDDAKAYVHWLSHKTKKTYRLLSEAEWEYVARAKTNTPFWWGKSISTSQANYNGNYTYNGPEGIFREKTVSADSFEANDFGLYNVHGNVWEWVDDCWHDNYHNAPNDGTTWLKGGDCSFRVLRGGTWTFHPHQLRSAYRSRYSPSTRSLLVGFRVSRTLVE